MVHHSEVCFLGTAPIGDTRPEESRSINCVLKLGSKTFWTHISQKITYPLVKEVIVNGVSSTNLTDLSDALNEHFSTIGPKLANKIPPAANDNSSCLEYLNITDQTFYFTPTNSSQLFSLLKNICETNAWMAVWFAFRLFASSSDMNNYRPISLMSPVLRFQYSKK